MKTRLINIAPDDSLLETVESRLSFEYFVQFVKESVAADKHIKQNLYEFLLHQINEHPELEKPIPIDTINRYADLLETIYLSMTCITNPQEESLWAIGMPLPRLILYGTDQFYNMMEVEKESNDTPGMEEERLSIIYSLILQQCYQINTPLYDQMVYSFRDPQKGHRKYYRVVMDARFIKINNHGTLPKFNFEHLEEHVHTGDAITFLLEQLPLHLFCFTGFTIVSLIEVTEQYAVQNIKNSVLENQASARKEFMPDLIQSLQSIVANDGIDFGFFPFVEFNNKFLLQFEDISQSILLNTIGKLAETESDFLSALQNFIHHPSIMFIKDLQTIPEHADVFLQGIRKSGYYAFGLVPLYYNAQLIGVLEICARKDNILTRSLMAKLDPALPYLAQKLKSSVDKFHSKITNVIYEEFTAIQPSVQWKFREVARNYLLELRGDKKAVINPVHFENVYPFYGAVDIKNSTQERRMARSKDLEEQFGLALQLLTQLKSRNVLPATEIILNNTLQAGLSFPLSPDQEVQMNHFFQSVLHPSLLALKMHNSKMIPLIDAYLTRTDGNSLLLDSHRSKVERSIKMINDSVGNYLALLAVELQQLHSGYFESFLTDGVEYDFYAGESITPDKAFDPTLLYDFRVLQLKSMAAIARL
ncbi:MAG TPA: hypothetical protein VK616_06485, partial [Flavitalea sp.]|nr:hypothetical protein [Flavitalea sp.]